MGTQWISRESNSNTRAGAALGAGAGSSALADPLPVPEFIQRFLGARGFLNPEAFEALRAPKLSLLKEPLLLKDMDLAVDRLARAFVDQEKICIYADFDLDGSSGLALLFRGLNELGFKGVERYQPKRLSEGYGFHASAVDEISSQGVKVIITVDVGITALEACNRAFERGIDVIITDHHQPLDQLPKAFAVVNPKRLDCTSGLSYLSGAGVAFYLLRALKRKLVDLNLISSSTLNLRLLLDYLTIGTLTDMVPLIEDNRPLMKAGLQVLRETQRPGLRLLMDELGLKRESLSSQEVAIRLSPKLNALSRMDAGILPIDLYLADSDAQAEALISQVMKSNEARVRHQQEGEKLAHSLLQSWTDSNFVFVYSDRFHRGVVGLLATKLASSMGVPAFVGSLGEAGEIVGSARWPQGQMGRLVEALRFCDSALVRHGGHHSAAGFELESSKTPAFQELLRAFFENIPAEKDVELIYDLDASLAELNLDNLNHLEQLEPYGVGFPVPSFQIEAQIQKVQTLRGGHLKFTLEDPQNASQIREALWFSPPTGCSEADFQKGWTIRAICEMQRNAFGGRRLLQLLIRELARK